MPEIFARAYDPRMAARNGKPSSATDKMIQIVSDLTHLELQFSGRYWDISFSATTRDGAFGARFKANKYLHLTQRWKSLAIEVTEQQENTIFYNACLLTYLQYDIIGVNSLITKLDIIKPDPNKTWCNRVVSQALKTGLPIKGPNEVTPDESFAQIERYLKEKERANAA